MFPIPPSPSEGIDWRGSVAVFLVTWSFLAIILLRDSGLL